MAKNNGKVAGIHIDPRLCKGTEGCSICIDLCPEKVLGVADKLSARGVHPAAVLHLEQCTGCDLCMLHCPDLALIVEHCEVEKHV